MERLTITNRRRACAFVGAEGKIKIAVQRPLSGEQSAFGEHIKLGAQLAVEESVKAFKAMGYDLVLVPHDDQAKRELGAYTAWQERMMNRPTVKKTVDAEQNSSTL